MVAVARGVSFAVLLFLYLKDLGFRVQCCLGLVVRIQGGGFQVPRSL